MGSNPTPSANNFSKNRNNLLCLHRRSTQPPGRHLGICGWNTEPRRIGVRISRRDLITSEEVSVRLPRMRETSTNERESLPKS